MAQSEAHMAAAEVRLMEREGSMVYIAAPSPPSPELDAADRSSLRRIKGKVVNILGGCAIILVIGFTVYLIRRSGSGGDPEAVAAMNERIAQIESRMTDTQDVMIALSEKLDRIDDRDRKGDET